MINTYLKLFLIVTLVGTTTSLECYQCDSRTDSSCKEHLDESDRKVLRPSTCTTNSAEFCVKTTGVWGGAVGTTRFCSSRDMFNQCQYVRYVDHDRIYRACIYTCKGDGCNSAIRDRLGWMTLLGLNLIALVSASKLFV